MKKVLNYINAILIPIKLILVVLMIFVSYEYLNKVFINREVGYGNAYRAMPENSVDVLVLGSSDAQFSFVPSFFYKDTGLYSYIIGTPCQPLEVSYEMFKEALKTQTPKLLILEVFTAMPLRSICEDDVCYVTAQYQMTGQEKYNTINYLPEEKAKQYRNDFMNYHNDWRTRIDYEAILPSNVFNKNKKIDSFFGYVYQAGNDEEPANHWFPSQYDEDIEIELDELDLYSLNNIYNLCQEKGIELMLYKTPIDGITQEDQSSLHKVWDWANEKGVKYIDFVAKAKEMKFYMQIHSDAFHCNINGASMITGEIADFVVNNYEINHTSSEMLDKLYKESVWALTKDAIYYESDPLIYLKRLHNTEGIICVRFNPLSYNTIGKGLYNIICEMGCSYFDSNNDYYAIIKDGELICEDYKAIEYDLDGISISINKKEIIIGDSSYDTKGPVSIAYIDKNNMENRIIKNIDYYPYPIDCGQAVNEIK